jgi:CHAT domain-containing protein
MNRFYKRLKAGDARSDALATTQKEFRDGLAGGGQWKEPYYWAAWQLVGDWKPIPGL